MPKSRHYPPSHVRYQLEHPPVTVHLNKKVKENLDAIKGDRSYAQVITEILNDTFDLEKEIKRAPVSELLVKYVNGFKEAEERYAQTGICRKCGREFQLCSDGMCVLCHKEKGRPTFSRFRDRKTAALIDNEDFQKTSVKIPNLERIVYENGRRRGYEQGWGDGYDEVLNDYRITYPCSVCGKPIELKPGSDSHGAMVSYMKENGWGHSKCLQ